MAAVSNRSARQGRSTHRPASRFVAGFIGHVNILPVTIGKARNGIAEVGLGGMRFPVRTAADVPAGPGHLALRHERIRIGPALGEARRGSAVIRDVVFSGPNVQYVLAAEGIELVAEAPYDGAGVPYAAGVPVEFGWEQAAPCLFADG